MSRRVVADSYALFAGAAVERRTASNARRDSVHRMEFVLAVILIAGFVSVAGSLRVIRESSERTAAATEALLELERSRSSSG